MTLDDAIRELLADCGCPTAPATVAEVRRKVPADAHTEHVLAADVAYGATVLDVIQAIRSVCRLADEGGIVEARHRPHGRPAVDPLPDPVPAVQGRANAAAALAALRAIPHPEPRPEPEGRR